MFDSYGSVRKVLHYFLLPIALLTIVNPVEAAGICASQLKAEVQKIAQDPKLQSSRLGVYAQTTTSRQVLTDVDGDRYFIPASTAKLWTTAAALKLLGADVRIATSLMSVQPPNPNGELMGDLWLIGRGDPSFRSETSLKSLVKQLADKGVRRIHGNIRTLPAIAGQSFSSSWEWQDLQEYYGAIASAFTINENALLWTISPTKAGQAVQFSWDQPQLAKGWVVENQAITSLPNLETSLQVERPFGQRRLIIRGQISADSEPELGGVAVPDPEAEFVSLLRTELSDQGIQLDSSQAFNGSPSPKVELATVLSPPLRSLVQTTNKDSNNLYAELLLRIVGSRAREVESDNLNAGILLTVKFLKSLGLSDRSFEIVDGSGLSRRNLVTPKAMVLLLMAMASDRDFRNSLPIAGVDGTLVNRFKDTTAAGNLRAKTGTVSGVIALSGYVKPTDYDEIAFAILINNGNLPNRELRPLVDAIALLLSSLKSC
jgi:serine-type D-Ala-D-Ala carboxypeptidase/endopeptidase (penicillin-binding protein 4)